MNFIEAIKSGFQNYANFKGRASRSEYWFWILFVILASIGVGILDEIVLNAGASGLGVLGLILGLALLIPNISVSIRRLHDIDRSGWWYLIICIPLIGGLVMLYWAIQKGTEGSNRFGNDPLFSMAD